MEKIHDMLVKNSTLLLVLGIMGAYYLYCTTVNKQMDSVILIVLAGVAVLSKWVLTSVMQKKEKNEIRKMAERDTEEFLASLIKKKEQQASETENDAEEDVENAR